MQIQDVMTKQVQCCTPEDSLERAAQLMWEHDCGCLPVCRSFADSGDRTLGMITDRDICMCALFQGQPLSALRVSDAMATEVLSCQAQDSLEQAERIMRDRRIRRLPVLDAQGTLIGMVSLADLAREATQEGTYSAHRQAEVQICDTLAAICTPRQQQLTS